MSSVISHFSPNLKTLIRSPLHHSILVPSFPHLRYTSLSYRRILADRQLSAAAALVAPAAAAASQKRRKGRAKDRKERVIMPGCDFNHWLVVMEFPNDPAPTREEMIETYLSTLSTVLGSMEEAKKNMYAFSTTTYTGFQCTVSEELTEKFKGLPGVLWVLPDSYLNVKNKDYGGDKFINGEIIPRTYPTYQPNQSNGSKSESARYERQDNPSAQHRTHQDTALPEQLLDELCRPFERISE